MRARSVDAALLILRIALGLIFMAHGAQKLFGLFGGPGFSGVIGMMGHMGFKPPVLWGVLLIAAEFFGGLGVLVGLLTRIAAAGILISQLVAVATVHLKNGFFLSNHGFEYNLSLIAIALALVFAGAGRYSLDWLFKRRRAEES